MNYNDYMTLKELGIGMNRRYSGNWDENYEDYDASYEGRYDLYDYDSEDLWPEE